VNMKCSSLTSYNFRHSSKRANTVTLSLFSGQLNMSIAGVIELKSRKHVSKTAVEMTYL